LHYIEKPAKLASVSEAEFLSFLGQYAVSCTRFYYLRWLDAYTRGMQGRLPPPYYEGPKIPVWDAEHDELVRANRLSDGVTRTNWRANMKEAADKKLASASAGAAADESAAVH